MTFNRFDVVITPFPFADRSQSVVRPVIILSDFESFGRLSGIANVAMVTSAKRSQWPLDVPITNLKSAGLTLPCVVRMKLNAVDYSLIHSKIGELSNDDRAAAIAALGSLLPMS